MKIVCPHCQVKGTVADGLLDKKVRCPECSNVFRVTEDVRVEVVPVEAGPPAVEDVADAAPSVDEPVAADSEPTTAAESESVEEPEESIAEELPEGVEACSRCGFVFSDKYIEKQDTVSFCTLCALRPPLEDGE